MALVVTHRAPCTPKSLVGLPVNPPTMSAVAGSTGPADFDHHRLCAPDDTPVLVVVTYDPTTGVPASTGYNLDGTPYGGAISDLGPCGGSGDSLESDGVEWCSGGVNVTQWIEKMNGEPNGNVYWTDASGAPIPAPAAGPTLVRGSCVVDQFLDQICKCYFDDTTGDGSNFVKFARIYDLIQTPTGRQTVLAGDFEDHTRQNPYTVLGPITPCEELGADAVIHPLRERIVGPGTWSPDAMVKSFTVRVESGAGVTYTDTNGTTTALVDDETFTHSIDDDSTLAAGAILDVPAGSIAVITYTRAGV